MCIGSGDPHYFTYDGQMIHFMGICKYTLSTSTAGIYFAVEVKNEHRYGSTSVSYTRMVDVKINNDTIRLLPESKILVSICIIGSIVSLILLIIESLAGFI